MTSSASAKSARRFQDSFPSFVGAQVTIMDPGRQPDIHGTVQSVECHGAAIRIKYKVPETDEVLEYIIGFEDQLVTDNTVHALFDVTITFSPP